MVTNSGRWIPELHEKGATILLVISTQAILVSVAAGALVTLLTLLVASLRTTRLSIASAVRSLPDLPSARQSGNGVKIAIVALGAVGLIAAAIGDGSVRLLGGVGVIGMCGRVPDGCLTVRVCGPRVGLDGGAW